MNIEEQVVNLELSKELKELGFKQESIFYWYYCKPDHEEEYHEEECAWKIFYSDDGLMSDKLSAFTASELMELLPQRITLAKGAPFNSFILYMRKSWYVVNNKIKDPIQYYIVNYECDSTEMQGEDAWLKRQLFNHNTYDKNLCNSLAKTLIKIKQAKIYEEFITNISFSSNINSSEPSKPSDGLC